MQIDKKAAEKILREASSEAAVASAPQDWCAKVEKLADLCEEGKTRTHLAMLVTAMLAKATNAKSDLIAFKPNHAPGNDRAYSARTLCHEVVVPLAAEIGFSIGVTGREPLNNQPYFRMERLDDGTPVSGAGKPPFNFALGLVRELDAYSSDKAKGALSAFVAVMRERVARYEDPKSVVTISLSALTAAIETLVSEDSEGGKRAQAVVAGLLDVVVGADRVMSGRINDPSRKYPGDVLLSGKKKDAQRAFEVRDKPVSAADIQIFARKCLSFGVRDAACVIVSPRQDVIDRQALDEWCENQGIHMTLFTSWHELVHMTLFWSELPIAEAARDAVASIHRRLIGVEASPLAVRRWGELAS